MSGCSGVGMNVELRANDPPSASQAKLNGSAAAPTVPPSSLRVRRRVTVTAVTYRDFGYQCPVRASLILLLSIPASVHAGAWARDGGSLYLQLGPSIFVGAHRDDLVTDVDSASGRFVGRAVDLYAEVGLGHAFELDLSWHWVDNRHELDDAADESQAGAGDVEALLKWAPVSAENAVSFLVGARVAPYETPAIEDQVTGAPPRGPGGVDLLAGFGWGHGFSWGWLDTRLLHRVRIGGASTGARLSAELGYRVVPQVAVAAELVAQPAFGRTLEQPDDAPAPIAKAWSVGAKLLANVYSGLGASLSASWLPESGNDGPGYRLAAGVVFER